MVRFSFSSALALLSTASQIVMAQQQVRVMPLGASIVSSCWRANLQAKLRNEGFQNFDFVGSQTSSCSGNGVDQNHEGHPGSHAIDYANNGNVLTWLDANPADVVLMLLGTNDVLVGKKPVAEILAAYDVLLEQMRSKNPRMQIVFSNLLPLDPARWPQTAADGIVALNNAIASYAPSKSTAESPVYLVDNFAGFDAVADTTDGEHPNGSGNEKMATKFFDSTKSAILAVSRSRLLPFARRMTLSARREAVAKAIELA